jgi:hypothetical protein
MKKSLLFTFLFAALAQILVAQSSCGDSTTVLSGNMSSPTSIGVNDFTPAPVPTSAPATATLPNLEYLVTNESQMSTDSSGAPIMGASLTGVVRASDFGISSCETFAVTPIAYSLTQLRQLTQAILNGNYAPGVTCCSFVGAQFPGFCDTLNAAGIFDSTDINSITDFFALAGALLGDGNTLSISTATGTIDFLNGALGFLGGCNGGVTQICYAVEPTGADYYNVQGITATSLQIAPDPAVIIGLGNSLQLTAQFSPAGSCPQTLFWEVVGGSSNVAINSATGNATGNGFDTVQVAVVSFQDTTLRDTVTLIVRDVQASINQNLATIPAFVSPNPVQNVMQITFTHRAALQSNDYQIRISDLSGKTLLSQQYTATEGAQNININTAELPQGLYILQLQHSQQQFIQKIVKQ